MEVVVIANPLRAAPCYLAEPAGAKFSPARVGSIPGPASPPLKRRAGALVSVSARPNKSPAREGAGLGDDVHRGARCGGFAGRPTPAHSCSARHASGNFPAHWRRNENCPEVEFSACRV